MPLRNPSYHQGTVIGWKTVFQKNGVEAGAALLVSDKVVFKPKLIRRGKEEHFILIQRKIHREDIIIINISIPNRKIPNFIRPNIRYKNHRLNPNAVPVRSFTSYTSESH